MIRWGRVVLVPAGDRAPPGRAMVPHDGRLELGDSCSIAATDGSLIETSACGTYLRVDRATQLETDQGSAVLVEPGLYQVVRTQE